MAKIHVVLSSQDYETLACMIKGRLEELIVRRANAHSEAATVTPDDEIGRLYKLLSKIMVLHDGDIAEHSSSFVLDDGIRVPNPQLKTETNDFLNSLRSYWFSLCHAVNFAIQYTCNERPEQAQYDQACVLLAEAIDNLRGYYTNIKSEPEDHGLYPFEPIKDIYAAISQLGHGELDQVARARTREKIVASWKSMREPFLSAFQRSSPTHPVSRYLTT